MRWKWGELHRERDRGESSWLVLLIFLCVLLVYICEREDTSTEIKRTEDSVSSLDIIIQWKRICPQEHLTRFITSSMRTRELSS